MKRTFFVTGAALLACAFMAGCASSRATDPQAVSPDIRAGVRENNVRFQPRRTEIIDWQDRTIGARVNPEWLLSIVRGNGNLYVQTFGISEQYANHKWFCSSAQNASQAVAQTLAETDVLYALASEMANTVNATVGQSLSDGQKDAVRTVCSKVSNVQLTGVGLRGTYWQLERTTDEYGNTQNLYNWYSLYSMPRDRYNALLNLYLVELLQSRDLDMETINAIRGSAQQILSDAQSQTEREELAKEREYKAQLFHEQADLQREREITLRTQANATAQAAANMPANSSVSMPPVESSLMSPALASLIGAM